MLDAFQVQLITIVSLLVGNILFGLLPLLSTRAVERFCGAQHGELQSIKWTTFWMFFGAGVFLSDSFLVLLPQANKDLEEQKTHIFEESEDHSEHHHDGFPIPEFIVMCGFFGAYILQELIHFIACKCTSTARKSSDLRVRFCSCAKRHTECSRTYKDARPDQTLFNIDNRLVESGKMSSAVAAASGPSEMDITAKSDLLRSSIIAQTVPNYGTLTNITEPATDSPLPVLTPPVLLAEERRIEADQQITTYNQNKLIVSSLLTVTALALQCIFIGVTLGLHLTSPFKWCYILMSCLQAFFLIFSASTIISVSNLDTLYIAFHTALLCIVSPVGVIIAVTKTDSEEVSGVGKGIVTAIACGVLMFTTFYEMLRHKRQGSVTGFMKLSATIGGACSMAGIQYAISRP